MQATVRFEHELLAVESEHDVWCMLELVAPSAPQQARRAPLSVALVIDRSGSMAGRKLQVTRECAAFLVERMAATDRVSIIAYDDEVQLHAPLSAVDGNRDALLAAIHAIGPGNTTNLSGGWLKGAETLSGAPDDSLRRVVLLSDGLANVGITDAPSLRRMAERTRAEGVSTSTIGFGEDFDEDLMTAMADAGGGAGHFAETPDDAPAIFAQEFQDLVSLVAQNVSVEIRPEPEVDFLGILNEFPAVPVVGGVQIQLGDAFGEERRRVVFRLHVPSVAALGPRRIADVVLRYVSVGQEVAHHQVRIPLTVNLVSADEAAATSPDAEVTEEVVILSSAQAGRQARELADRGDYEGAERTLRDAVEELSATAEGSARADELLEQAEFWHTRASSMA
ncbi:MAG TPA: VWA domain-containing protein, partial [Actinomycetota bacterium]|nr:VWA domain-containing protein [Actinomycetota bacterium]